MTQTQTDNDRLEMMDEANTYWQTLIEKIPHDDSLSLYPGSGYTPSSYGLVYKDGRYDRLPNLPTRDELVSEFSWAIPCPTSLRWILERLNGQGVIEMGAGTGYWSALLTLGGADVVAYDEAPPDQAENWFHSDHETYRHTVTQEDVDAYNERWGGFNKLAEDLVEMTKDSENPYPAMPAPQGPQVGTKTDRSRVVPGFRRTIFFPVQEGSVEKLAEHRNRALLLCWPPHGTSLAHDALKAFPGDTLFFIGEGDGGCTGDDDFFRLLYEEWEEIDTCPSHISWSGIRDYLTLYRRKS